MRNLTISLNSDWKATLRAAGTAAKASSYQGETFNFESASAFFGKLTERQVAVKVLMRSDHQQLDSLWVQNAVGEQARLVDHLELVYLHTGQIADLGFANFRGSGH